MSDGVNRPTWESDCGTVKLWLGDCMEVMKSWPDGAVDAVVTDPPWKARKDKITRRGGGGVAKVVNPSVGIGYGTIGEFSVNVLRDAFRVAKHDMLVICGYKELGEVISLLEPIRGVFIWHKPNGGISVAYPCPLDVAYVVWGAHTSRMTGFQHWRSGVMSHSVPTAGCISNGERILSEKNGKALHPAQGPISLYCQLLQPNEGTIADCYMGTGTCGVAAVRLGRQFWGVEIDPEYFETSKRRIQDELAKIDFLEPQRVKDRQAALFSDED